MREPIILGALLTVALAGAWFTWTAPDEDSPKDAAAVPVFYASADQITKVAWKGEKLTVELEKKKDDAGEYVWVVATETIEKKAPKLETDTDTDAAAVEAPPIVETKTTAFKGNSQADDLWKALAPMYAMRELDTSAVADASVFGLDKPAATLEVTKSNGAVSLVIGAETWGAKDRYVGLDKRVFLVDDQALKPLQYAKTRLVERGLQPLAEADIEKVAVSADGQTAGWTHANKDDRAKAYWANDKAPDHEDTAAAAWVDKVVRLKAQSWPDPAEAVPTLTPAATFTISGKSQVWTVELSSATAADGATEYWAKSPFTRGLVKLPKSSAAEIVTDLADALASTGGTAPAATPEPAPASPTPPAP